MKKASLSLLLASLMLLGSCGSPPESGETPLRIVATTYPVYLFVTAVTEGAEGVEVTQMNTSAGSCLHDYTLTMNDMKAMERADLIFLNGVGLEEFMSDALAAVPAPAVDCSEGVMLLPSEGHEDHDHINDHGHVQEKAYDPHIWMSPKNAIQMINNIALALSEALPAEEALFSANAAAATVRLTDLDSVLRTGLDTPSCIQMEHGEPVFQRNLRLRTVNLITFHDGFSYFADAYGLKILKSIEEEEGSETSAMEIKEIVALLQKQTIPAIFTEVNGSDATAKAISRETGVEIGRLSMLMSGDGEGLKPYIDALTENVKTIDQYLGY